MFKFILLTIPWLFISCTKNADHQTTSALNIAVWGNYLSPAAQKAFSEKYHVRMLVTNYSSNEELLAKVQAGTSGLDLVVPSDYMVGVMVKLNLLEPLDTSRLANFKNISKKYLNQSFDPQNRYSVPYAWSTAGIAIDRTLYKGKIKGWGDVFGNKELGGKFSLLDDAREVLGAALKFNGFSVNTLKESELTTAKNLLLKIKPQVKTFSSDTLQLLKNKDVFVAHTYSVDVYQAQRQGLADIEYVIPQEGGTLAIDNFVILKGAANKENALKLIDESLTVETNAEFVARLGSGPVLEKTREVLPVELRNNPILFPTEETLAKTERIVDLGEGTKVIEKIWAEIKAK